MKTQNDEKFKRYRLMEILGEGQYAVVYKATDVVSDTQVAVKKIKAGSHDEINDGINRSAIREAKFLREMEHPNVLKLRDIFSRHTLQECNIFLVFDYMDNDLEKIIRDTSIEFDRGVVKGFALMLMQGIKYLHDNWILHRDLKPNNLLVSREGVLKIADFGLARIYPTPNEKMTSQVVTRWYRAPELLMAADQYGFGIDIWAAGCIIAEIFTRVPFLPGENDIDQLHKIFAIFGIPDENNWPGVTSLKGYFQFKVDRDERGHLDTRMKFCDLNQIDLVREMMVPDPNKRASANDVLAMAYFSDAPEPLLLSIFEEEIEEDKTTLRR